MKNRHNNLYIKGDLRRGRRFDFEYIKLKKKYKNNNNIINNVRNN